MNDDLDNSTVEANLRSLVPNVAFLELRIQGASGTRHLPFLEPTLDFHLSGAQGVRLHWTVQLTSDFRLLFQCHSEVGPATLRLIGEEFLLGDERLTVVDLRTLAPYRLRALSPEQGYRAWSVHNGVTTIGRPGRRPNTLALAEASVSRTHARIEVRSPNAFLIPENDSALCAVNGRRLDKATMCSLQPGDVVQFGELLFRWEREERAVTARSGTLCLRALGECSVALTSQPGRPLEVRNGNAKDLLFWLASRRDSELPIDRILNEYWPDRPPLRQRKNLSHSLRALQAEVGWSDAMFAEHIVRSPETLRMNSKAIESYDLWDLQAALRSTSGGPSSLAERLELHPGPFLPHSQSPWVRGLRAELFLGWLEIIGQCQARSELQVLLGETITRCLRDADFEEFVYRKAFTLARKFGLNALVMVWFVELRDRLQATTGDAPSEELECFAKEA